MALPQGVAWYNAVLDLGVPARVDRNIVADAAMGDANEWTQWTPVFLQALPGNSRPAKWSCRDSGAPEMGLKIISVTGCPDSPGVYEWRRASCTFTIDGLNRVTGYASVPAQVSSSIVFCILAYGV